MVGLPQSLRLSGLSGLQDVGNDSNASGTRKNLHKAEQNLIQTDQPSTTETNPRIASILVLRKELDYYHLS